MVSLNLSENDSIKNESFHKILKEVAVEKKADLGSSSALSMSENGSSGFWRCPDSHRFHLVRPSRGQIIDFFSYFES